MKKLKFFAAFLLSLALLTSVALAAMPNGTVVIGDKAFDMDYANDPANYDEILEALLSSNGLVLVKKFNGEWIDNNTGGSVSLADIPAVTYKDADGKVTQYDKEDGAELDPAAAALEKATKAVEKAEASILQADYDAAKALVNALPDGEAKDALLARLEAVKEAIDDAASEQAKAVARVNAASSSTMQGVLESNAAALGIDLTVYNTLTFNASYKQNVALIVFNARSIQPDGKYADAKAIKAAFDNAVAQQVAPHAAAVAVNRVNSYKLIKAGEIQAADIAAVRAMIEEDYAALGLSLGNYSQLAEAAKNEAIKKVIEGRNYNDAGALAAVFNGQVATEKADLDAALAAVNNDNVATIQAGLENAAYVRALGLNNAGYNGLGSAYKAAVAAAIKANKPVVPGSNPVKYEYKNIAQVKLNYDSAVLVQALKQVNDATTAAEMKTALENNAGSLGINLALYNSLGKDDPYKNAVAASVFEGRKSQPNAQYPNAAAVKAAFDAVVAQQKPLAVAAAVKAINDVTKAGANATDAEKDKMLEALVANAAQLGYNVAANSEYSKVENKRVVANAIFVARGNGFANAEAIKTAFDNAVAAQRSAEDLAKLNAAVAAVNIATRSTMRAALEANAAWLQLAMGDNTAYKALTDENKTLVGALVYDDRMTFTGGVFPNREAIKSVFDTIVAARKKIQDDQIKFEALTAVNSATTAADIAAVLANANYRTAIGISLTEYNKLRTNQYHDFQLNVRNEVLKPVIANPKVLYSTVDEIKNKFNAAVTTEAAKQATDDAAIDAINNAKNSDALTQQLAVLGALEQNRVTLGIDDAYKKFQTLGFIPQLGIADFIITARGAGFNKANGIDPIRNTYIEKVNAAIDQLQGYVDAFNNKATISEMRAQVESIGSQWIVGYSLDDYNKLNDIYKNQVAQNMLLVRSTLKDGKFPDGLSIRNALLNIISDRLAAYNTEKAALDAVNVASAASMRNVLEANYEALKLDLTEYNKLSNDSKNAVAAYVLAERDKLSGKKYADVAAIKAKFDAAIVGKETQVTYVARMEINNATTVSAMRAAIEKKDNDKALGLDLTEYNKLTADQKNQVASGLLAARAGQPNAMYPDAAAIKTVLDTLVAGFAGV